MAKKERLRLDKAWSELLVNSGKENPSRAKYLVAHHSGVGHGRTNFTRHDFFWNELLGSIQAANLDYERLDVLITACSVGAEVYDASRIAQTLGLENIYFYGHDKSEKFMARAVEGVFPISSVRLVPDAGKWFEFHEPCRDYARIRPECFENVSFLPPSDIRDLKQDFDVAVENIMNPCPSNIEELMKERARHLAITTYDAVKISEDFKPVAECFEKAIMIKTNQPPKNPDTVAPGF